MWRQRNGGGLVGDASEVGTRDLLPCLPVPAVRRVPRFLLPFPPPWTLVVRRWVGPRDWWVGLFLLFSFLLLGSEEVVRKEAKRREGKWEREEPEPS